MEESLIGKVVIICDNVCEDFHHFSMGEKVKIIDENILTDFGNRYRAKSLETNNRQLIKREDFKIHSNTIQKLN
ncbi:MAG: hypothetical protein ACOC1O_01920 [bacterium]